jgi:2',5'-phosphodiesterase
VQAPADELELNWIEFRRSTGKEFGVATYHMPCQFRIPSVMVIHTALVAQRLADLFKSTPLIW